MYIAVAHAMCSIVGRGCDRAKYKYAAILKRRIEKSFLEHMLHGMHFLFTL